MLTCTIRYHIDPTEQARFEEYRLPIASQNRDYGTFGRAQTPADCLKEHTA